MNIKGVIFDLDGTITDSETYARLAMKKTFADHGFEWDPDFYNSMLGVTPAKGDEIAIKKFKEKDFANQIMQEFSDNLFASFEKGEVGFKPGALELINYLNENNFPIALATSASPKKLYLEFESQGVAIPFKVIVNSAMVEHCKPDPEIFFKAAEALNLDIKECMVIEDSSNGIEAAIRSGAVSVLVPDYVKPSKELMDQTTYIKNDLFEVMEILKPFVNPLGNDF